MKQDDTWSFYISVANRFLQVEQADAEEAVLALTRDADGHRELSDQIESLFNEWHSLHKPVKLPETWTPVPSDIVTLVDGHNARVSKIEKALDGGSLTLGSLAKLFGNKVQRDRVCREIAGMERAIREVRELLMAVYKGAPKDVIRLRASSAVRLQSSGESVIEALEQTVAGEGSSLLELTKTEGLSLQELNTLLRESAARVSAAISGAEKKLQELLQAEEAAAAKEKAELERESRKREREIRTAKEEEERRQREIEEAVAKDKAELEKERRKRERKIQAVTKEEERRQREIEEARDKRVSSLAFLKEKARHTTAPFVFGGFSVLGLLALVIWFPAAGCPALALFIVSEICVSPNLWRKAVRQIVSVLASGRDSEIIAADLKMEGVGMETFGIFIVMSIGQLVIGIILSFFLWVSGMEGGFVDVLKLIFPLGWKAGAGFLVTALASAIASLSWVGIHRSIHVNKILRRFKS